MHDEEDHRSDWAATAALFAFLMFLGFPVADLVGSTRSVLDVTVELAAVTVFVALYVWLMWNSQTLSGRREWMAVVLLAALALGLALVGTAQWAILFIYVAAVCGFRLPRRGAIAGFAVCAALAVISGWLRDYPGAATILYGVYTTAVGLMLLAFSWLQRVNRELRAAREEIARLAVSQERLRFARDLHDLLGHSLSLIALKSELAGHLVGRDPARAATEVADIERVARSGLQQVRDAAAGYRQMTLKTELAGARMALSAAGIDVSVHEPDVALEPETETILAWAVREGTTNVIRHSHASRCEIRVSARLSSADVEVLDDGCGGQESSVGGTGLLGLTERASKQHGRVEAGARPGGGFRLCVIVPTT